MNEQRPVTVLMGGPSAEHAISLKSGQGVVAALTQRGWSVNAVVIPQELTVARAMEWARQTLVSSAAEVVFLALHGPFGEDGTIQRVCDEVGVAYTGSGATASALGLDKVASRKRFVQQGLRVPDWQVVDLATTEHLEHVLRNLRVPVVIKPTNQGSSFGVSIVVHRDDVLDAIENAARYDTRVLIETLVRGREVTVGILGEQALPVVEIRPRHQFFDYTAKYTLGQTTYLVPAELSPSLTAAVQQAGMRAHQALGCRDCSRVDLILNDAQEPVVLEVNTIPGFTATSLLPKAAACAGISYDDLCERLVMMALKRKKTVRVARATS